MGEHVIRTCTYVCVASVCRFVLGETTLVTALSLHAHAGKFWRIHGPVNEPYSNKLFDAQVWQQPQGWQPITSTASGFALRSQQISTVEIAQMHPTATSPEPKTGDDYNLDHRCLNLTCSSCDQHARWLRGHDAVNVTKYWAQMVVKPYILNRVEKAITYTIIVR